MKPAGLICAVVYKIAPNAYAKPSRSVRCLGFEFEE